MLLKKYMVFFCVFFICCSASLSWAELERGGEFSKANDYYAKGQYDLAIGIYEKLLPQGYESANIYYNMGNCYFKKGMFGRAILFYERALRIEPRDKDIAYNLTYAKTFIKKPGYSIPFIDKVKIAVQAPFGSFTVKGIMFYVVALYVMFLILLYRKKMVEPKKPYNSLWALALLFVMFIVGSYSLYLRVGSIGKEAVVVSKKADVSFGPFEKATVYYTLNEGVEVSIIDKKDRWYKIERPDGKAGWVKRGDVEAI